MEHVTWDMEQGPEVVAKPEAHDIPEGETTIASCQDLGNGKWDRYLDPREERNKSTDVKAFLARMRFVQWRLRSDFSADVQQ